MLTAAPELGHQLMIPTMFRIMIMLMKINFMLFDNDADAHADEEDGDEDNDDNNDEVKFPNQLAFW